MNTSNIIDAINTVAEKIFKEVEGEVYVLLDKLLVITPEILNQEPLKNLFFESKQSGVIILTSSFLIFFTLYFVFLKISSMYTGTETENIFKFIIRIIISAILMSTSFYICYEILHINYLFTEVIKGLCQDAVGGTVSFYNLKETITDLGKYMSNDFLSIDGMIKGLISFGAINLVLNFSIRYATIIFLILLSPLAFMFSASNITLGFFKSWMKTFILNLMIQSIVMVILTIPLSFKEKNDIMFKIVMVGTIYILYKLNNFTKELFGNMYQEFNSNNLRGR